MTRLHPHPSHPAPCAAATPAERLLVWLLTLALLLPAFPAGAAAPVPDAPPAQEPEQTVPPAPAGEMTDTVLNVVVAVDSPYRLDGRRVFNPSPTRAAWMSALLPGLGQIYNRRYWKLPIIVGGFMGLGYATNWNNNQFQDYNQAYRDLLDDDPNTTSYMNFFPPTTHEDDLDKTWLTSVMKSRKDYYRRNRDLCIISMVALYLLCMVDAYVDAAMSHFDISPSLSMDVQPALWVEPSSRKAALGLNWALTF